MATSDVSQLYGGVTPYNETETYAEAGHYGATVVSPGFRALMAHLHVREFGTFICNLSQGSTSGSKNAIIRLENCAIDNISKSVSLGDNIIEMTFNGTAKTGSGDPTANRPIKWWTV